MSLKSSKWTVLVLWSHAAINDDKVIIRGYDKIALIGGDDRWLEPWRRFVKMTCRQDSPGNSGQNDWVIFHRTPAGNP